MLVHIHIKNVFLSVCASQKGGCWVGILTNAPYLGSAHPIGSVNIDHDTLGVSICFMAFFVTINKGGHDTLPHRLEKEVFASL